MSPKLPSDSCDRDWIWNRAAETAGPEEILDEASRAWRRQRETIRDRSAFWLRRLGGGVLPDLGQLDRLPLTTKQELTAAIAEAPPFGSNAGVEGGRITRVYQTSGTTGEPSVIALTAADEDVWTEIGTRTYYATGIHDHHSVLSTYGAGPFVAGHTTFVLRRIGCRAVPVGPGDTERVLFALRRGLIDTMLATPSFAQYLANRLGGEAPSIAGALIHVVTGGEPGGGIPAIRDHVQSVLGATVTEVMGIGDVAPSLFGECPLQQGMHFCGAGHVWPELVDPDSGESVGIETGAVGELVYTHLTREAMPVVRFRSGDVVRVEGTSCGCGRTGFRMRCLGRRDDMFIVRGVNVYPSAILAVVGDFRPRVSGRARVVVPPGGVAVEPPIPVQVETGEAIDPALVSELETAIRSRLGFRSRVELVAAPAFGDSGYKTRLSVRPE